MAKKILLADDSPTIRKVVELTFADEGIDVYSVPDGDAAMVKFVQVEPDLVIADVNMPGMSGYRLCEMIKNDEEAHHIPVILLVGSFEPFDPGEASRVGCDHYFTKPFRSIRELVDTVNQCFSPESGAPSAGSDVADIEDLYKSSLEPAEEEVRPEDEVHAFAADADVAEENHFDDGASLDHFLSESRRNVPEISEHEPEVESGYESVNEVPSADTQVENPSDEQSTAALNADLQSLSTSSEREASSFDDTSDDDVLWFDGIFAPKETVESQFMLDVDASQPPDEPEPEPAPTIENETHEAEPVEAVVAEHETNETEPLEAAPPEVQIEEAPAEAETSNADLHMTALPTRSRTTGGLGPSPWEQPVTEDVSEKEPYQNASPAETTSVELGDASMDDEIIETSHPSGGVPDEEVSRSTAVSEPPAAAIDPFNERVEVSDHHRADIVEHAPPMMDDEAAEQVDAAKNSESQQSSGTEPPNAAPLGSHVTPELIESIVASVLEKMSDRAVRQAAQEAVPRIAEKLIREALTDDERDAQKDAANG